MYSLSSFCLILLLCIHVIGCIPAPPPPLSTPESQDLSAGTESQENLFDSGSESGSSVEENVPSQSCLESRELMYDSGSLDEREWIGVIYELRFAREEPNGVSLGSNIDDRVSTQSDAESCYHADLTSPDGREGIDNQFSQLLPLVEAVGGEAIEGLAQGVINQGRLLLMLRLSALDDPGLRNDDCLHLESFYGRGSPHIGTQGYIVPGQTFDRDDERPSTRSEGISLTEGSIKVDGLSLELPLEVFDQSYLFELDQVSITAHFTEEGELSGYISAALDVEAVANRVEMIEGGGMIAEIVPRLLRQQADLAPDDAGVCRALSMTLTFKARQAFLYSSDSSRSSE